MSVTNCHSNNCLKPDVCTFTISCCHTKNTCCDYKGHLVNAVQEHNQSSFLNITQHRKTLYEQMLKQMVCEVYLTTKFISVYCLLLNLYSNLNLFTFCESKTG